MTKMSCVICAYNEVDRLRNVLDVVAKHPLFDEVIVVDDGSTDQTSKLVRSYSTIRLLSYGKNRGKAYALSLGIAASSDGLIMLLDADLDGLTAADLSALAEPVLGGRAEMSMSLGCNSLALYRLIGLDFVSGERVIPKSLLMGSFDEMRQLPRWGGEVFMNRLIVARKLRVSVVRWTNVRNVRKYRKVGLWHGVVEEFLMILDLLRVISPAQAILQTLDLLTLSVPSPVTLQIGSVSSSRPTIGERLSHSFRGPSLRKQIRHAGKREARTR